MDLSSKATIKWYFSLLEFFQHANSGRSNRYTMGTSGSAVLSRSGGSNRYSTGVSVSDDCTPGDGVVLETAMKTQESMGLAGGFIFDRLKSARIFSIPEDTLMTVWNVIDDYVISKGGVTAPPHLKRQEGVLDNLFSQLSEEDGISKDFNPVADYIYDSGPFCEFPKNLPFECMYFGYGNGVNFSPFQIDARFSQFSKVKLRNKSGGSRELKFDDLERYTLNGHLVCSSGEVVELCSYSVMEALALPDGEVLAVPGIGEDWTDENLKRAVDHYNRLLWDMGYKPLKKPYTAYCLKAFNVSDDIHTPGFREKIRCPVPTFEALSKRDRHLVLCEEAIGFSFNASRVSRESVRSTLCGSGVRQYMDKHGVDHFWTHPVSLCPWLIPTLINVINENNKTFVFSGDYDKKIKSEIGSKHRKFVRRKKNRPVLPAYYVIDVKPNVVRKAASKAVSSIRSKRKHVLTHRHDRDGHERVHVKRGLLPLSEEECKVLRLRNYVIYTEGQPSDENKDRLVRRRLPLREAGEWLAIRAGWVRSSVVGDESLPYRPAVRRLSKESILDLVKNI